MSIAFVFPGQGSQSVGMMSEFYEASDTVRETFGEASQALGYDLWSVIQSGPGEKLNQTNITQPAMLASGIACWRAWQEAGGATATIMAGHSLGEYSALTAAGVLDFADAIKLVEQRGELMQSAVAEGAGAMAAILGLDDDTVRQVCGDSSQGAVVQAVNFNAPGQVVIAGESEAVDRATAKAKEAGAKRALKLPVSVPSHCDLMQPAAEQLGVYMQKLDLSAPVTPVVQNASASVQADIDAIRDALVAQLHQPVLWVDTVQSMAAAGVTHIVELGPGKVLTGLCKRIDKSITAMAVINPDSMHAAIDTLNNV